MRSIVSMLHILISVGMVFLILLHSGKDTGLSGMGGIGSGGSSFGGGALLEKNLNRWTVGFAIAFLITTIALIKL